MDGLGGIVSVADLAFFFRLSKSSVYAKIKKEIDAGKPFPCGQQSPNGRTKMLWLKEDIEPYLIVFQTFSPSAERVRKKFGKVVGGAGIER